jgi:imidazole glycerol-phosphate synthase subunit HisH
MLIGIIDHGRGNITSIKNAIEFVGADVTLCCSRDDLSRVDKLVLPGVGAFRDCMEALHERDLVTALTTEVLTRHKSILGICVGMQVMMDHGSEGGGCAGLGWFKGATTRLLGGEEFLLPHIGWNEIECDAALPLFDGLPASAEFYFLHSYRAQPTQAEETAATSRYGEQFTAAIARKNIYGVQFHPEKSLDLGLKVFENFIFRC